MRMKDAAKDNVYNLVSQASAHTDKKGPLVVLAASIQQEEQVRDEI